jgi:predicted RNase H-like HicB family nuclease
LVALEEVLELISEALEEVLELISEALEDSVVV